MTHDVFITGIGGFVGRYLAAHLSGQGLKVAGSIRPENADKHRDLAARHTLFEVDIRDPQGLQESLKATQTPLIYHLAASAHPGQAERAGEVTHEINVGGTQALLIAAAREIPQSRVLLVGSGTVYGATPETPESISETCKPQPTNRYSRSKLAVEALSRAYLHSSELEVICVRAFNHTGPGQSAAYVCPEFAQHCALIALGRTAPEIRVGNLAAVRDFLDVRDVVRAYDLILNQGQAGEIYNVCSGEGRTIRQILDVLIELSGKEVEVIEDPKKFRKNDAPVLIGSNAKIQAACGWQPQINFDETIENLFSYFLTRADGVNEES